jgi:hypothetical protein
MITFGIWVIPTLITIGAIIWATFIVDSGSGYGAGLPNVFALVPALAVSLVSWIVYAIVMAIFF